MRLEKFAAESLAASVAKWQLPDRKESSALLEKLIFLKDLLKVAAEMELWLPPSRCRCWRRSRR